MHGLHAYKHWHVHADEGSPPCGGCGCGLAYRSRSRVPLASELRRSLVRASTSAARTSILVLAVVSFLSVVPLQRAPQIWVRGGDNSRAFVKEGFE